MEKKLLIRSDNIPKHVAVIMDGNGRWAKDKGMNRIFGHKNAITDLVWTPDNQRVITSSKDCNLIMWDIESQKKMFFKGEKFNRTMQGHFDEVLTCAISPNGKYLVSGGKDRIVRIWDLHNQKQI